MRPFVPKLTVAIVTVGIGGSAALEERAGRGAASNPQ
jgi:hypothetical protein